MIASSSRGCTTRNCRSAFARIGHPGRVDVDHDHVVGALRELADERLQRQLWLSTGADSEVSSFGECICRLFDDSGLSIALGRGQVYADDIDADLQLLDRELRRVDERQSPEAMLGDPVLRHVRQAAAALVTRITARP